MQPGRVRHALTPIRFGPRARPLFGVYHPGAVGSPKDSGVLLCNPFGHEAIRIHRLFRLLAERLSRAGVHVLRFDYHGTGDSPGEDEEGEMRGWQEDVHAAHRELQTRSSARHVTWMGARLGAAIALRAAHEGASDLRRVVLWEPVLDGQAYVRVLRVKHVEALELSYCIPDVAWRRNLADDSDTFQHEAIGFAMSTALRRQLAELDEHALSPPAGIDTLVVADPDDATTQHWMRSQAQRERVRYVSLKNTIVWTSDPQPNSAMVPSAVVQQLIAVLDV